ncbi:MAG: asparagine--tRNA ligase [Deltaproteobacteria bacterium]|nr:asparagine--tRNA ligase [Deltaproteobacteria bacterium]
MIPPSERIAEVLAREAAGGRVLVRGWLRTARHTKGVSFLELGDGSCMAGLQVVAGPELANYESELRGLVTGCAVEAAGELVASPAAGQRFELRAERVALVGPVGDDYPLQKKRHSFEYLRTIGHLRLRTNTLGAVLRVRHAAARAIRRFFDERGFLELQAPIVTASDAEGAGAQFRVTTIHPGEPPRTADGAVDWSRDFFGRPTYLTVSGQLEAEIAALALSRVYTFGPTFRAEPSNTSRHLAEFWMIEPELAFCDLDGNVELAEAFLRQVVRELLDRCGEDLAFFDERIERGLRDALAHVADTPFERMTYTEAVSRLERSGKTFEYPVSWGADLQSEHERWLSEEHVRRPLVVTDYPRQVKAFYMYLNDDERTVRAMDVLVPRVGEIVGGSQREHRAGVLERRMRETGLDPAPYWWYLELRRHGGVPHAGFGLGFERLLQFVTGMANIRDVIPFPRTPGSAEF